MRTEYEVCTARGAIVKSFDDRTMATRYAREIAETFPDCAVFEVVHHEPTRRRIFTPGGQRARLQLVPDIEPKRAFR